MASYTFYTGDGVQTDWAVPFSYLAKAYVKAKVDGAVAAFTWVNSSTIRITPAIANGASLYLYRETARDPLVTWVNTNNVTASRLNLADKQAIHLGEEARDRAERSLLPNAANQWDFDNLKGINVATPTADNDVANKKYVDDTVIELSTAVADAEAAAAQAAVEKTAAQTARTGAETARDTVQDFILGTTSPFAAATETWIPQGDGTDIGNMTANGGLAAAFDGTRSQSSASSAGAGAATNAYIGKQLTAAKVISRVRIFGANNAGFRGDGALSAITLNLYGSNSLPASATDGTLIGTLSLTNTADESAGRDIYSNDLANSYAYVWVQLGTIGARVAELEVWEYSVAPATLKRPYTLRVGDYLDARDYGVRGDDELTDSTAGLQAAIDRASALGRRVVLLPPGVIRLDTPIVPKNYVVVEGLGAATIKQYGSAAIGQTNGVGLTEFTLRGVKFEYAGAATPLNCALDLDAHQRCSFTDLRFSGYDSIGIIRRKASGTPGNNTVFNEYRRWYVEKCAWLDWAQGLDSNYAEYTGDGATTAFAVPWNFTNPADIAVGVWKADATIVKKTLALGVGVGADEFSVAGGGGSTGTVTLGAAPGFGDIVMVWPRSALGRVSPISSNVWEDVTVRRFTKFLHAGVRYIDSEKFYALWGQMVADNARGIYTNPFSDGNGECDLYTFHDPTISYGEGVGEVSDETTLRQYDFGPGTEATHVFGGNTDKEWTTSVGVRDNEEVALLGTASVTNGSAVVAFSAAGKLTKQITLFGATPDRIKIITDATTGAYTEASIASVDSDTQLTLSSNWTGSTAAGLTAYVTNPASHVSYDIYTKKGGTGVSDRIGRYRRKSGSFATGTALILDTTTSITVKYGRIRRTPTQNEIRVNGNLNRTYWVTAITSTGFTINSSSAPPVGQNITVGWTVELADY